MRDVLSDLGFQMIPSKYLGSLNKNMAGRFMEDFICLLVVENINDINVFCWHVYLSLHENASALWELEDTAE